MKELNFIKKHDTLYSPEQESGRLSLSPEQKEAVQQITLGVEEVDEAIRSLATEDVITTLENGHSLNRLMTDKAGGISGYVACEDFVPQEAYIKYLATTKQTGRELLQEIPAFLEFAKQQGYTKLNFHGWNERLNKALERYGFERVRTDKMADFSVDFYEKVLAARKTPEKVEEERRRAFEQKYVGKISQDYRQALGVISQDKRLHKEQAIAAAFASLAGRLAGRADFEFGERQQAVLKLKLARHFQNNDVCDLNVLFDALVESPKFLSNDKGSLHRLFEVHEEKTVQKIAELRKKRAEMGSGEASNPYEILFTTVSGEYCLARLLNMPHLEEESEYMKHCVGTSDSYISRIKRGEIEILSLRHVPKINQASQKLQGDTPIMTIEYNVKTNSIEQMKKFDDEYLKQSDPYFADVIDALKQLRGTKNDTDKPRNFSRIAASELNGIEVKDYCILTEQGEVSFREVDPADGLFVLKYGKMPITAETSIEDAVKILRLVEGIEVRPEQIARSLAEVNEDTSVYIGPLEHRDTEGKIMPIFQKIGHLDHIYTAFPEGKISKLETAIGGPESKEELISKLEKLEVNNLKIYFSDYAKDMIRSEDFAIGEQEEAVSLVRLKVKDFGFGNNPTTDELYAKAQEFGLEPCPAETGPRLRLSNTDQPNGDYFRVAMKQISGRGGSPRVFGLGRYGGGQLVLNYDDARPGRQWDGDDEFVFRLRKLDS